MLPICASPYCNTAYQPDKNDVYVFQMSKQADGEYTVYQVWSADRVKCPGCGHVAIQGFGQAPMFSKGTSGSNAHMTPAEFGVIVDRIKEKAPDHIHYWYPEPKPSDDFLDSGC